MLQSPVTKQNLFLCVLDLSFFSLSNIRLIGTERNANSFLILFLSLSLKITRGGRDKREPNMPSYPKDRVLLVAVLLKGEKWRIMITKPKSASTSVVLRGSGQGLERDACILLWSASPPGQPASAASPLSSFPELLVRELA